jgi:hypothetical protein
MDAEKLRRYSGAEVALLGVFALGLLLSHILVKVRSTVELDAPVELALGGVSVALPKGPQWETAGGWRYEGDNSFVLLGRMGMRGQVAMNVRWRYVLCGESLPADVLLRQIAASAKGHLLPLGKISGAITMQYGRIYAPADSGEEFLMGIATLDLGRSLELQISYRSDASYAENIFLALAEEVVYHKPAALTAGVERVKRFYSDQWETLFNTQKPSDLAFLIQNEAKMPIGYAVCEFSSLADGNDSRFRIAVRQFESSGLYVESELWQMRENPTFKWKTQTWASQFGGRPQVTELIADEAGRMTVERNVEQTRILQRTPMMLPEPFLIRFMAELEAEGTEIILDVLTSGGVVVPTRVVKVDPQESPVRSEQAARTVRAEYLHTKGEHDDLVFDAEGRLLGVFEQKMRKKGRLWETTSQDQLRRIFGERFRPRGTESAQFQK